MTAPLLAHATAGLAAAGVTSPRVDAELLLAHVLTVPRSRLLLAGPPSVDEVAAFESALERRIAREPLQYIVGTAAFRHIEVAVGRGVFIPRPETELLIDAVLPTLRAIEHPVAVDLCSGSGALALAIADEVPGARVLAVERPGPSGEWLLRNVAGANTAARPVEAVLGDIAAGELLAELRGTVDALVCNPPYVPGGTDVAPEVLFDPGIAVFAGEDGLALMPHVVGRAGELLRSGGVLALEHDDTQGDAVPRLLHDDGRFTEITDHHDLTGRPRYTVAARA